MRTELARNDRTIASSTRRTVTCDRPAARVAGRKQCRGDGARRRHTRPTSAADPLNRFAGVPPSGSCARPGTATGADDPRGRRKIAGAGQHDPDHAVRPATKSSTQPSQRSSAIGHGRRRPSSSGPGRGRRAQPGARPGAIFEAVFATSRRRERRSDRSRSRHAETFGDRETAPNSERVRPVRSPGRDPHRAPPPLSDATSQRRGGQCSSGMQSAVQLVLVSASAGRCRPARVGWSRTAGQWCPSPMRRQ
jgi:hypothetical protein